MDDKTLTSKRIHLLPSVIPLSFYNSISKKLENFIPQKDHEVILYVCGLTPYDSTHIGHARTYVAFDLLKRLLLASKYKIFHIQNITDVEDKIIKRCIETGADPIKLTTQTHDEALELFDQLGIIRADVYPKVTENIDEIIILIKKLIEKKFAYETTSGVYFSVSLFSNYGELSSQNLEQMIKGARVEVDESKRDPLDFALWKKTKGALIEFDSPWGRGRPGWHIECSAIAEKFAKRTMDIHGGARDLIFPHHENEIAQSEAALGRKFTNFFLHTGFLTVEGEKMSKSLGNFITLKNALSKISPAALRLFFIQTHYRSPIDYDEDRLMASNETLERIYNSMGLIRETIKNKNNKTEKPHHNENSSENKTFVEKTNALLDQIYTQLANDLNTPEAFATLFELLRTCNSAMNFQADGNAPLRQLENILKNCETILWIFGISETENQNQTSGDLTKLNPLLLELGEPEVSDFAVGMEKIIHLRNEARKNKDYKKSDLIRQRLKDCGVILEDTKDGLRWKLDKTN